MAGATAQAPTTDGRFVHEHPQLAHRFEPVEPPWAGTIDVPTLPFRRVASPSWLTVRPPTLGEHNDAVLGGVLGLTPVQLADLAERQVIDTRPVGA